MFNTGGAGNVIAALCSVFIPGLGQLLQGRWLLAIALFIAIGVGYWFWWFLVLPAVIAVLLHLYSIISAARFKGHQ